MAPSNFVPAWTHEPPEENSYRSIFKWGASDQFKHPNQRLYALLKKKFNLSDDDFKAKLKSGNEKVTLDQPIQLSPEQIQKFREIVGEENINIDDYHRLKFACGKTMEEALELRNNTPGKTADLVVHPRSREDIQHIVTYCNDERIPIYVYGGGSSVNFGFRPVKGGVTLVMSTHLTRVIEFNEMNQTLTVESGIMGPDLEDLLNHAPEKLNAKNRYTCGHFPQSFEYSSLGGWIVTLGSGQQSSYYGDMYDLVVSQEYITPTGSFKTLDYISTATGPKINDIMKGSEGCFGVLVSATIKVFRYMPENRQSYAFIFSDWTAAVTAAREISQGEFGMPGVFRISDAEETDVALKLYGVEGTVLDTLMSIRGYKPMQRCLLIGRTEGEKGFSSHVKACVKKICQKHGAMYLTGYPVKNWEHGRFADPYMREDLNDFGIIIDTLETGVNWDQVHGVHQMVREFIKSRPDTICMTHASHFYKQGTNLYFIFIAKMDDIDAYREFQGKIIAQIAKSGGSLSHHHGVGKMIAPFMEEHLGKVQMDILRALKRHFDPNGIMNPGNTMGLG